MSNFSRRDVIRWTGLAALGTLVPLPFRRLGVAEAAEIADYSRGAWVPSCCNMCGGQCGINVFVQDGRVRKIEPHATNPNNIANVSANYDAAIAAGEHSRLCCKGNSGIKSLYDPDRLRTPLRRIGPRGSGLFEPISWDDAVAETAMKLKSIRARYGARSLVWFGEDHSFTHPQQDFCDAFGSPNYSNHANLCDTSRKSSFKSTFGDERPLADLENADLCLIWGWNFLSAIKWVHLAATFTRARNRAANPMEFIYIDPVFNVTASKADQWVPIKPGTDGALALALCKLIIDSGAYDTAFVASYTLGLGEFRKYLDGDGTYDAVVKSAAWASGVTGVPAADIAALATKLTTAFQAGKKICIDAWSGPGHHTNATQGGRAIACLSVLFGAVDKQGTLLNPRRKGPGRRSTTGFGWPSKDGWRVDGRDDVTITEATASNRALTDVNGVAYAAGATIPAGTRFHKKYAFSHGSGIYVEQREAMVNQRDFLGIPYPVKAAAFVFQNVMMSTPNVERSMAAMQAMEFVFCVDTHLSETAMWADIVFPGSNYLERNDFNATWVTFYCLGLRQQVVPSWINGRTETQLLLDLGAAMGFGGFKTAPENTTDDQYLKEEWDRFILGTDSKPSWAQLKQTGVWIETGTPGGTKFDKYKGTSTFAAATMSVSAVTVGAQTVYVVKNTSTGAALGLSPTATLADGAPFEVGFATETRRAQFWSPTLDNYWKATPTKYPAGANVSGNAAYHPLPFYSPPLDAPTAQYPLHFISWKEVEHTHSRTHNNVYLNELKPETRLYIHPTDATPLGLEEGDACWVQSAYGQIRAKAHVTKRIMAGCVGFFRGHGHWALGQVAKGKGSHDGWLLPGRAEVHSGQAVHKEVGCRVYKVR